MHTLTGDTLLVQGVDMGQELRRVAWTCGVLWGVTPAAVGSGYGKAGEHEGNTLERLPTCLNCSFHLCGM